MILKENVSRKLIYIDVFRAEDFVINPEQILRAAIKDFLSTPDGEKVIKNTHSKFDWSDALVFVPEEIWNKHGIKSFDLPWEAIKTMPVDIIKVNQNEVLCDQCLE